MGERGDRSAAVIEFLIVRLVAGFFLAGGWLMDILFRQRAARA